MNREIQCLTRLFDLTQCQHELLEFLIEEKLITKDSVHDLYHSDPRTIPKSIHEILTSLKNDQAVQLIDYMWNILPVESICVTIITDTEKREFTYTK